MEVVLSRSIERTSPMQREITPIAEHDELVTSGKPDRSVEFSRYNTIKSGMVQDQGSTPMEFLIWPKMVTDARRTCHPSLRIAVDNQE
jgi:hypothetical protein